MALSAQRNKKFSSCIGRDIGQRGRMKRPLQTFEEQSFPTCRGKAIGERRRVRSPQNAMEKGAFYM
jgi:hypothetical protein